MNSTYLYFIGVYYFLYFSLGALFPFLSQYFDKIGLSGTQVGVITSVGPVISIFVQPLWGMLCDRTQRVKTILAFTIVMSALVVLWLPYISHYYFLLIGFALLYFFQSAVVPITDTIALQSAVSFGRIRQWGAVGFAVAVFVSGLFIEKIGFIAIFLLYAISFLSILLFVRPLPAARVEMKINLLKGLCQLIKVPRFSLFLLSSFFIFGPINGNNIYFGLLFEHIGGSIAGIGFAFLLFAGSEAPFMKGCHHLINRWGLEMTILFAGIVSSLRWLWYSTAPSPSWVLWLFFLQGISVGVYLVTAARFVQDNSIPEIRVTAMSIYASVGLGLGSMAFQLSGGIILEHFGILSVYRFFGLATLLSIIPLLLIRFYFTSDALINIRREGEAE